MKTIPEQGRSYEDVLHQLDTFACEDPAYKDGKTWSLVYYKDEEYTFREERPGLIDKAVPGGLKFGDIVAIKGRLVENDGECNILAEQVILLNKVI